MQFRRVETNKSFALTRVNSLLGKVFSVAATLVGIQTATNALNQFQQDNLDPFWFWISFGSVAISHLLIILLVWFRGNGKIGFAALSISTLFSLITWTSQLSGGSLQPDEKPWMWWGLGIAGISAVGGFGIGISAAFLLLLPAIWLFIEISNNLASVNLLLSIEEATFSFLFSTVLAVLVVVLRYESSKVDEANQKSNDAAIELAKSDAIHRERDRVDALVHDSVLTTLLVAANANDSESQKAASELAIAAIQRLTKAQESSAEDSAITVNSLFSALAIAIARLDEETSISSNGQSDLEVPSNVAEALTESTLQAVSNALQHAGTNSKIEILLRGMPDGVKIVIKDDGKGFRVSRVPKNRLGLKLSIFGRIQAVGGKVFVDSKLGVGTNIVLEWSKK
jgi:signal transduction histidine kinase